jgi:hypothetical protein
VVRVIRAVPAAGGLRFVMSEEELRRLRGIASR